MSENNHNNLLPTSEVGSERADKSASDKHNNDQWRELFEQQNENVKALIQALSASSSSRNNVVLPEFNPDNMEVDARSWCATADLCFADNPIQGGQLIMVISKVLKGAASAWLSQVTYPGMTWLEFKDLFIARFVCTETNAGTLINFYNNKPSDNESLPVYASRLISSLLTRWRDASKEQIAVSTVLAHIAQFDSRLQRLAFTTEISSRQQLQKELQAFSFLKRKFTSTNDTKSVPDVKRPKLSTSMNLKCFHCGKIGHRQSECRQKVNSFVSPATLPPIAKQSIVCFKCGEPGHVASRCTSGVRPAGAGGSQTERRVDLCVVEPPSGTLEHHAMKKTCKPAMLNRIWQAGRRALNLEHSPPHVFACSQWQNGTRPATFYIIYRWLVFLSVLSVAISSFICQRLPRLYDGPKVELNYFKWFIYFTNWGYILIVVQAGLALTVVHRYRTQKTFNIPCEDEEMVMSRRQRTPLVCRAYWLAHTVATDLAFVITLIYWTLVHDPRIHDINTLNLLVHGGNSILMLVELMMTAHPVRAAHAVFGAGAGLAYGVFSAFYWTVGGTDRIGLPAIYPALDWNKPGSAFGFVALCAVVMMLSHGAATCVSLARGRLAARLRPARTDRLALPTH